jgi:hypothetical protein
VIVDEGATLGDRDLAALLAITERNGAVLRIIGDPAQHHSVPAGGCWTHLVTTAPTTPELTTVRRLADAGERARADALRRGRIHHTLTALVESGQLELSDSDAATYAKLLARWYQARLGGEPHPMVHGRNTQRRLLNQITQQLLIEDGDVDPDRAVTTGDGRRLCVGDEVIARHGDRRIHPAGNPDAWMRNGTTGTITNIAVGDTAADDRVTISTAAGILELPRRVFDRRRGGLDHSYAVTSYAVQGATRTRSTSAITASTTRAELYVDITRGQRSNKVYGTRRHRTGDDRDRHLPTLDRDLLEDLTARLATGTGLPAAVADPTAARLATTRTRSLGRLLAERRAGRLVDAGEIERATVAVRAGATIPAGFATILPAVTAPPPAAPPRRPRRRRRRPPRHPQPDPATPRDTTRARPRTAPHQPGSGDQLAPTRRHPHRPRRRRRHRTPPFPATDPRQTARRPRPLGPPPPHQPRPPRTAGHDGGRPTRRRARRHHHLAATPPRPHHRRRRGARCPPRRPGSSRRLRPTHATHHPN